MKKNLFVVAAVALAMVACNKEEINTPADNQNQLSSVKFTAYTDVTKTVLNDDRTVSWAADDEISINGAKFSTKEAGTPAIFDHIDGGFDENAESFSAVYPYSAGTSFASVTIPSEQTINAGGFPTEGVVSVASSTTTSLSFKNVTSLLSFQVPTFAETVTSVTISSDEYLAGKVSVDYNNGQPTWEAIDATKEISVKGTFKAGETYYVSVLPSETHTFTVRINGYLSKASTKDSKVTRSAIMNMGELPAPKASTYSLMGIDGDWDPGKVFYVDVDECYLLKNITFTSSTEFKFTTSQGETKTWGRPITFEKGRWAFTYDFPNDNMKGISGTYDIWVDPQNDAVCFVDVDSAKPAFTNENKLVHILYEATDNCGLYIESPSTSVNDYNNTGAWGNYQTVYMKKTQNESQNYCAFPLPSNVVGVSSTFTIRVWGDKNKTYTMTITDDTPFWGNSDSGNYYALSSKINIL